MLLVYALWFSSKRRCSLYFSVLLFCPRVACSMFPSVCCCHRDSLTRGRLAFAQEAVRGPSFSLFGSAPVGCAGGFKQPVRNVSSSDAEFGKFCNYVKMFCRILPHFTCLHRTRPFILGTLWRARKVLRLVAVSVSSLWITIRRTSSRLFRCVVFDCATMYFPFSHCIL